MCGPAVPFEWIILDVTYLLVLVTGGIVMKARAASLTTFIVFGALSTFVGTVLFTITFADASAMAAAGTPDDTVAMLRGC